MAASPSALRQWPVQLHLVSPAAPYFQGAHVLLAADCTAFAMGDFHSRWLPGKSLAVACPKLDQGQDVYLRKLVALAEEARIESLTVLVMQVPCCAGLVHLAAEALRRSRRKVPLKRVVVNLQGEILSEEWL
ncbi:MAG: 4Fe-4S ferredoxin [Acidobacteriota bacterium]